MMRFLWLMAVPTVAALHSIQHFDRQVWGSTDTAVYASQYRDVVVSVGGCFEATVDRLVNRTDVDGFRADSLPIPFDDVVQHGLAVFPAYIKIPQAIGCAAVPDPGHALAFVANSFSHERNKWDTVLLLQ